VKLSDLGESGLIDELRRLLPDGEDVTVGVGDDAAVVRTRGGSSVVVSTDALVDRVHFRLDWSSPADVGHKAVSVNVSDIAAMGAEPRWILVALCAPGDLDTDVVKEIYGGMTEAAASYGAAVVGGDTVRAQELVLSVTAIGELDGEPMTRSVAKPGDVVAVTGPLGRAAAGVNLLLSGDPKDVVVRDAIACIDAHRRPAARVREGRALRDGGVRAALDISDGLATDAGRLADASGVGIEIDEKLVPVATEARSVGDARGWDVGQMVLVGGEDFELLVAAPADVVEQLELIAIGRVTDGEGVFLVRDGERTELGPQGWDHFRA
jgi:thiamine-monophosphate kinase